MPPGFLTAEQHKALREEAMQEFKQQKNWTKQQAQDSFNEYLGQKQQRFYEKQMQIKAESEHLDRVKRQIEEDRQ